MIEYRTVDTSTLKGLEEAEALKEAGWQIGSVGSFTIQFYRKRASLLRKTRNESEDRN